MIKDILKIIQYNKENAKQNFCFHNIIIGLDNGTMAAIKNDIIITDIKYRMTVPAIRSLSKRGYRVYGLEYSNTPREACLGYYSKYLSPPLPFTLNDFLADGENLIKRHFKEKPVVIPFGAKTLAAITAKQEEISAFSSLVIPTETVLALLNDKDRLLALGEENGIPIPFTTSLAHHPSIEAMASSMPYPAVIKYRSGEALGLKPAERYKIIHGPLDFIPTYQDMHEKQTFPIAQEYVEGEGLGVSYILDKDGDVADFIAHRRLREYPVSGGPSCYCETIFDENLVAMGAKLLKAAHMTGVAMVEFKGSTEKPVLMEVNPRFWGSSPLIAAAGSGFYEAVVHASLGINEKINAPYSPKYRVGQKMRFLLQDMAAYRHYLKNNPRKARFTLDYIGSLLNPKTKDGLFAAGDSRPFFRYVKNALGGND